jgi:glycosyltransferase involved in cell wall biosynthesis
MEYAAPKLSIVICTHNRAHLLTDCLASLTQQTAPASVYEVIIIDNNSTDTTKEIADGFVRRYPNFRYFKETRTGLSHARNLGSDKAASEWIAYLDDDARALDDYAQRAITIIEQFKFDCFGGPAIPVYHENKPAWYQDAYQSKRKPVLGQRADFPDVGILSDPNDYVSGFNFIIRKSVLGRLGGFNPNIGMKGKKIAYGEETLLQVKIRKWGGQVGYDNELRVVHYIDNYKLSLLWFLKSSYANGKDHWVTFEEPLPPPSQLAVLLIRSFGQMAKRALLKLPKVFTKGYYLENWVIDVCEPFCRTLGMFRTGIRRKMVQPVLT